LKIHVLKPITRVGTGVLTAVSPVDDLVVVAGANAEEARTHVFTAFWSSDLYFGICSAFQVLKYSTSEGLVRDGRIRQSFSSHFDGRAFLFNGGASFV
jgi:hypothetical protein